MIDTLLYIVLPSLVLAYVAARIYNRYQLKRLHDSGGIMPTADEVLEQLETIESAHAVASELYVQQEQHTRELSDRYKLIFEHSIVGLSFYTPDGWLINANAIMREICHFDSEHGDEFFSSVNLFDMPPFNEIMDRHDVQDYWACSLSIIPERNMHVYLEINVHPVRDVEGRLVYVSVSARDVTSERELYMQAKRNDVELKRINEGIQRYETELRYMMESCGMQSWRISLDRNVIEFYSGLNTVDNSFTLQQLQSIFVDQDNDFVRDLSNPAEAISKPLYYIGQMHPVVSRKQTKPQWVQINCIPEYDEEGRLKGAFGVWRNINQLMQKQQQLKQETERANESGKMKSVFLANMTHEIRTPLNAIVGFTDVLSMVNTSEEKQELIRLIKENCDMLLRLINDILDVSSLDAGGMTVEPAKVDFAQSFNEMCQSLEPRVKEAGLEFQKDNPYDSLYATVDEGRIRQVMTNLVTNSVKYTKEGHIRLGYQEMTKHGKEGLYIYCEDTGVGIPKELQERIFERFFKINDYVQGTGLGLSICKAIADACHGEIGLKSEGVGSTFWLWVPREFEGL